VVHDSLLKTLQETAERLGQNRSLLLVGPSGCGKTLVRPCTPCQFLVFDFPWANAPCYKGRTAARSSGWRLWSNLKQIEHA